MHCDIACRTKQQKDKSSSLPVAGARSVVPGVPPSKHQKSDKVSEKADRTSTAASRSLFHKRFADNVDKNGTAAPSLPRLGSDRRGDGGASQKIAGSHTQDASSYGAGTKESPSLGAPSPLADSHQPSSFSGDPMMPTLSPHPPSSKCHDKDGGVPSHPDSGPSASSSLASSLEQQQAVHARLFGNQHDGASSLETSAPISSLSLLLSSPPKHTPGLVATVATGANKLSPVKTAASSLLSKHMTDFTSLKRPLLAAASYEDEDADVIGFNAIYDLDSAGSR